MKPNLCFGSLAIALYALIPNLAQANETQTRAISNSITGVVVDGVVSVTLHQGPPSLTVHGDPANFDWVQTSEQGAELRISTRSMPRKAEVSVDISLPNLIEFANDGVGSAKIDGFTSDQLHVRLNGAGGITMNVTAKKLRTELAGVGNIRANLGNSGEIQLTMSGTGNTVLEGSASEIHAHLVGVGNLDAAKLTADSIFVDLGGTGSASAYARNSANVELTGIGSIKIFGNPKSRQSKSTGLGKINWE